jgi:hypothetical protein
MEELCFSMFNAEFAINSNYLKVFFATNYCFR